MHRSNILRSEDERFMTLKDEGSLGGEVFVTRIAVECCHMSGIVPVDRDEAKMEMMICLIEDHDFLKY